YFAGARLPVQARHVARVVCLWSLFTGLVLSLTMWIVQAAVIRRFVPAAAVAPFIPAWRIALVFQPISALAFATDGIHWGLGDFAFLRNVVLAATTCAAGLLFVLHTTDGFALSWIWTITGVWLFIRAAAGLLRIWPGTANSPIRQIGSELSYE
ncbi:MAG: hypothetical protein P8X55_04770, partial [Desulfosarcinaceae bacterium]